MRITQTRLDQYRGELDTLGKAASTYTKLLFSTLQNELPAESPATIRGLAKDAIAESLNAFGP